MLKTPPACRAGIYIRVSTEEQHLNGLSLPAHHIAETYNIFFKKQSQIQNVYVYIGERLCNRCFYL